jgi:hypothetical protein
VANFTPTAVALWLSWPGDEGEADAMPTLEDTAIDFPVTTLNDLLEAEAKTAVPVSADEEKYRKWAFISTGAAGLLAIILIGVLITGGGKSSGGSEKAQTAEKPAGWSDVPIAAIADGKIPAPEAGNYYKVTSTEDGTVLADAAMLTSYKPGAKFAKLQHYNIVLAVPPAQEKGLITANPQKLNISGPVAAPAPGQPAATTTTTAAAAPAAETPSAPTPEAPVPETSPATQPAG